MEAKINILLIDDNPVFFDKSYMDILLPEGYERFFCFHWIQTPAEAAWLLDIYNEVSTKVPQNILELGLPPEILIFDYALSAPQCSKIPEQSSNIIKRLQNYLEKTGINVQSVDEYSKSVPDTGADKGSDRMGCYLGGTFARTFSNYPCAAIPTTAHISTKDTDAIFFEWLNKKYFRDAFAFKTRPSPELKKLIHYGLRLFRDRVIDLINANLIRITLKDIESISQNPAEVKASSLSIYSKLGFRKIPIAGLFIDTEEDENAYEETAKTWAVEVLKSVFKTQDSGDFYLAKNIANDYFKAFLSEPHEARYDLAALVAECRGQAKSLHNGERDELLRLCHRFHIGVDEHGNIPNPHRVKVQNSLGLWKHRANGNERVARWAALMLMIKAEQFYRQYSNDFEEVKRYETDDGLIDFKKLVGDYGRVEADRLVESLKLRKLENTKYYELATAKTVSPDEILVLLDPLPETLLTIYNGAKDFKKESSSDIHAALRRVGLNIISVLNERSENGLRQGEGYLLRLYADEIGFDEKGWPSWLKTAL